MVQVGCTSNYARTALWKETGDFRGGLFCVMQPLPQAFRHQTRERIRCGICHQTPIQRNPEMKMKTGKRDRASKLNERHKRVAEGHRRRRARPGINRPATRYQKAHNRPNSNPESHDKTPAVLLAQSSHVDSLPPKQFNAASRVPLRDPLWLKIFESSAATNLRALTISAHSARILEAVRNGLPVVSPNSGPVAQLGARFHGMEEVVGSIPTRSTIFSSTYGYPRFQFGVIWCQNALTSSKLRSGQPLVPHGWFPLTHRL